MSSKNRRSKILIEPYKQLRFGITFILINFLYTALLASIFSFFIWDIYQAVVQYFSLSPQDQWVVAEKFSKPVIAVAIVVFLFIVTTLWVAARYTHQFYGPLVSIRRFLDNVIRGNEVHPISIRKNDQLQDVVERLNKMISKADSLTSASSAAKVEAFIDALIEGQSEATLNLPEDDPLRGVADRLNKLSRTS